MLTPTQQQQNIINLAVQSNNIVIEARAGASKTTTCEMIANKVVKPSLYIAFNKDIASEAEGRFPSHVTCKTIHSLAYKEIIKFPKSKMGQKLQANLDINDIREVNDVCGFTTFTDEEQEIEFLLNVRDTVISFCQSADKEITDRHIPITEEASTLRDIDVVKCAKKYWVTTTEPNTSYKISHDVYLKLYQLYEPCLAEYEVIYLDEAQDSNPVTLDIFNRQVHTQRIIVGDPYQAIYEWRGAINAFEHVPASFKRAELTESFRYTQAIADLAKIVVSLSGEEIELIGRATKGTITTKAILCRKNTTLIYYMLSAVEKRQKVYTNVNLKELWGKIYHVASLWYKQQPKWPNKELAMFKDYATLAKAAGKQQDLKALINITSMLTTGNGVNSNIAAIKNIIVEDAARADIVLSTAHKSKGLEWDEVTLDEDMLTWDRDKEDLSSWIENNPQEINLLYVAVTRGKYKVNLPDNLQEILR